MLGHQRQVSLALRRYTDPASSSSLSPSPTTGLCLLRLRHSVVFLPRNHLRDITLSFQGQPICPFLWAPFPSSYTGPSPQVPLHSLSLSWGHAEGPVCRTLSRARPQPWFHRSKSSCHHTVTQKTNWLARRLHKCPARAQD
jgi:hypothetical protein